MNDELAWQRRVAAFARSHDLLHDPTTHALDLVSEGGALIAALKKYERRQAERGEAGSA